MIRIGLLLGLLLATTAAQAQGTLSENEHIDSPALGRELAYAVYLPGEHPETEAPYPVVYLLHGLGGRQTDWPRAGRIGATLDRLIAAKRVPPLVVVMPDGGNSWYVDSAAHGAMERAIVEDLRGVIEDRYPVMTERRGRFVAGLSMGGYGAIRLALYHPDLFRAAASLSGAIFPNLPGAAVLSRQQIAMFRGAFGAPFDPARFNAQNMFDRISVMQQMQRPPGVFLTVGDHDGFGLYRGAFALFLALRAARLPVELRVSDGDHNWRLWRRAIEGALVYFAGLIAEDARADAILRSGN